MPNTLYECATDYYLPQADNTVAIEGSISCQANGNWGAATKCEKSYFWEPNIYFDSKSNVQYSVCLEEDLTNANSPATALTTMIASTGVIRASTTKYDLSGTKMVIKIYAIVNAWNIKYSND